MFRSPVSFVMILFMASMFSAWMIADYLVRGSNGTISLLPFIIIYILGLISGGSLMLMYKRDKEDEE